jgi:DNA invertase Pin-like site-specific DNA recombinase
MTGQRVSYIRTSTAEQNPGRQLDGLDFDRVFADQLSGDQPDRPQLRECIAYVRDGDTLYVHSLDRLARNLVHLRGIVDEVTAKGATVEFVKERLVFSRDDANPFSTLRMSILGSFAEFELAMIRSRQREGIAKAKARGVYTGRKPSLTSAQADELKARAAAGERKSDLAREFGISRKTVYDYLAADHSLRAAG